MKKISIFFISLFLISIVVLLSNCKKDKTTTPAPTTLQITFNNSLGNAVQGASVKLYSSQTDWTNGTNQIGTTQTSDASGKVTFSNLQSIVYYWWAQQDCMNNYNGSAKVVNPLTANATNTVTCVLSSTGTVTFTSTSSNPYDCYINGTRQFTLNGGLSQSVYYLPVGAYTFRVLQLSGYVLTPTDETFNSNIVCDQTTTITFP